MLTDTQIKAAKPIQDAQGRPLLTKRGNPKLDKLSDGQGLYLLVTPPTARNPKGTKLWRFKYFFGRNSKGTGPAEKVLALGQYPHVSLSDARERRADAQKLLAKVPPIDPSAKRRETKNAGRDTFAIIAEQWVVARMEKSTPPKAKRTIDKARGQLRDFVNPTIGNKPLRQIVDSDLLPIFRAIESEGKIETAYKTRELLSRIFRYAKAQKLCDHNIVADLEKEVLPVRPGGKAVNLAAILDRPKLGELLRAIDGYNGQPSTCAALRLLPHVFLRSTEIRGGRWPEINWETARWTVPAERMKPVKGVREAHVVPLSRQALAILKKHQKHTDDGNGGLMFPCIGRNHETKPISENTFASALFALGYDGDKQTPHGFRAIFRTIAAEDLEIRIDWLEIQLAHAVKDANGNAYNRASFVEQRVKMMQQWSNHLDKLKAAK